MGSESVRLEGVTICLWCGSDELDREFSSVRDWFFNAVDGEFGFDRCAHCDSLVLAARPVSEDLFKAYQGYYTHESAPGGGAAAARNPIQEMSSFVTRAYGRARYGVAPKAVDSIVATLLAGMPEKRLALDCWHRFLPRPRATVLDYGCGNGDFLLRATALGHKVMGVDFDDNALEEARARGLDARHISSIDDSEFLGRFDAITLNHVIEHVPDPRRLLERLCGWLKSGGRVYLECPNSRAAGLEKHGQFWRGLEAPRHFGLPSQAALDKALRDAGFGRIDWHPRKSVRRAMDMQAAAVQASISDASEIERPEGHIDGSELLTLVAWRDS